MNPCLARLLPWIAGDGRGRLPALVLALLAMGPSWGGCELQQMEIPVRIVNERPIATVQLNGTDARLLLDSGAFFSMLTSATATQLNLPLRDLPWGMRIHGYTGPIEARRTVVEKLGLPAGSLPKIEFLVGGNELGSGIMGILGRNILSAADTEYDLAHGVVRLSFPKGDCGDTNFAHWAGEAPVVVVPMDWRLRSDTAIRFDVRVNGARVRALMDTGAPHTGLSLKAARRAGIEEKDLTPTSRTGGAGEGRVKSWTGKVASFELGGEKVTNNVMRIDDVDSSETEMLVGLDYFLAHRIYVSGRQNKIYITWNGGPVFARVPGAQGVYDARYAATPTDVPKDDADALARRGAAAIAAGDHQRALEDLNRACELAPGVADYFDARARLHQSMQNPRAALADLDRALSLDAGLVEARFRRAALRASQRDGAGAQADLAHLDAALPGSSELRSKMGNLYARFSQVPEAMRQYDLWIGSHPQDERRASVFNERCWLRARLGIDLPLALKDCRQAVDLDEGAAAHRDSLGWTHLRMGEPAKAKEAFDGAIKIEALAASLYGRGLALRQLNDEAASARDLAAARRLNTAIDAAMRRQGFRFAEVADVDSSPEAEEH